MWSFCATLPLGPSLLVFPVRLAALGMGCEPGPDFCRGVALGAGLRDAPGLAWLVGSSPLASFAIASASVVTALRMRRPLMASLSVMILPLAALVLPALAVSTALHPGCQANEAGVGDCQLWGGQIGMSFHRAAMAPWISYGAVPYCFPLALMIGTAGMFFFGHAPNGQ